MSIGIRTIYVTAADQTFTADANYANITGISAPIAANQRARIRCFIPVTVAAAGGAKARLQVPAGGADYVEAITLQNTVAPATVTAAAATATGLANALANAGTHFFLYEATIQNGATAGNIVLQGAQDSAANASTFLQGTSMEVTYF